MATPLASRLLDDLLAGAPGPCRLSVIGLSKNAGKTVTLNHLIQAAADRGLRLGLVSTGRDGEEQDAVTELPKPRIWAPAGAWVATAREALAAGTARVDIFRELPMRTPFGPLLVGRVAVAGELLLIGPGSAQRLAEVLGCLEAHGAELCLVDGSFDRMAAAAPEVTGRVVLAAGAAYSASMGETVAQVRHLLALFDLPAVPEEAEWKVGEAVRQGAVSLITATGAVRPLPVTSGLGAPEPIVDAARLALADAAGLTPADAARLGAPGAVAPSLVLRGALGDRLLLSLLKARSILPIIVHDPTRVLVERNLWRRWRRQGGIAYVRRPVRLLAVTTNASTPLGPGYDPAAFYDEVARLAGRPVYDLVAGHPAIAT